MQTIRFRHAHFTARLPVDYRYTPSHFWLLPAPAAAGEQSPDAPGSSPQAAEGQAATEQGTLWRGLLPALRGSGRLPAYGVR